MIIANEKELLATAINHPDAKHARMKVPIAAEQGWVDHVLRIIELGAEGHSPRHTHDWPHINYIIEGEGIVHMNGEDHPVTAGGYAYIPANVEHQFRNTAETPFRFICIVPKEGHD
ncbi:MAG: cupin domain-containing protein [Desulfosarcinaceae bacterium]